MMKSVIRSAPCRSPMRRSNVTSSIAIASKRAASSLLSRPAMVPQNRLCLSQTMDRALISDKVSNSRSLDYQTRDRSIWTYLTSVMGHGNDANVDSTSSETTKTTASTANLRPTVSSDRRRPVRKPASRRGSKILKGKPNGRNGSANSKHRPRHPRSPHHHPSSLSMPAPKYRNSVSDNPEIESLKCLLLHPKKTPIGSFQESTWAQAEQVLRHLVEEEEDSTAAFIVLDRLVKEPDAKDHLTFDIMYLVMLTWGRQTFAKKSLNMALNKENLRNQRRFGKNNYVEKVDPPDNSTPYTMPPVAIWRKLEDYQARGIVLDDRIYHRVIDGASQYRSKKAMDQGPILAETILNHMLQKSQTNPLLRPSTITFNAVLQCWTATDPKSAEHVHALLTKLKQLYQAGWGEEFMPDSTTYRRVMTTYAHLGDAEAVENLLEEMFDAYNHYGKPEQLKPKKSHFSLVLYAWSKSTDEDAAERATAVLEGLLELEKSGTVDGVIVDAAAFNIVMICWSKLRTKKAAKVVVALYEKLIDLYKDDPTKKPSGGSYAALVSTLTQHQLEKGDDAFWAWHKAHKNDQIEMKPDHRLFNRLVSGWFHSKHPDALQKLLRLLDESIFGELKDWKPTPGAILTGILALVRQGSIEGMENAENMLRRLEKYEKKSSSDYVITPKVVSPIISGWANMGEIERATNLLREFLTKFEQAHHEELKRTSKQNFNSLLKAWSKKANDDAAAADSAEKLLLEMGEHNIPPTSMSFTYVSLCRQRNAAKGLADAKSPRATELVAFLDRVYYDGKLHESENFYKKLRNAWTEPESSTAKE